MRCLYGHHPSMCWLRASVAPCGLAVGRRCPYDLATCNCHYSGLAMAGHPYKGPGRGRLPPSSLRSL
ncbi:hypothetical protein GW17_00056303 [Ensete ventricosum]|nr:hypothetical protein GW17_00056303 [Ensete ventricosum]